MLEECGGEQQLQQQQHSGEFVGASEPGGRHQRSQPNPGFLRACSTPLPLPHLPHLSHSLTRLLLCPGLASLGLALAGQAGLYGEMHVVWRHCWSRALLFWLFFWRFPPVNYFLLSEVSLSIICYSSIATVEVVQSLAGINKVTVANVNPQGSVGALWEGSCEEGRREPLKHAMRFLYTLLLQTDPIF